MSVLQMYLRLDNKCTKSLPNFQSHLHFSILNSLLLELFLLLAFALYSVADCDKVPHLSKETQ